jgi:hypothetical protein
MFASMLRRIYEAKEKIALALGLPIVLAIMFAFLLAANKNRDSVLSVVSG